MLIVMSLTDIFENREFEISDLNEITDIVKKYADIEDVTYTDYEEIGGLYIYNSKPWGNIGSYRLVDKWIVECDECQEVFVINIGRGGDTIYLGEECTCNAPFTKIEKV